MNLGLVRGQSELGAASREATLRCYTDASCAHVVLRNTRFTGPALAEDEPLSALLTLDYLLRKLLQMRILLLPLSGTVTWEI